MHELTKVIYGSESSHVDARDASVRDLHHDCESSHEFKVLDQVCQEEDQSHMDIRPLGDLVSCRECA